MPAQPPPPVLTEEVARRFAAALAAEKGVTAAIVSGRDGDVLGGSGAGDVRKEAALASFVAQRAEALTEDSDLRGMGKALSHSTLQEIVCTGPGGEAVLLSFPGCHAFVSLGRGTNRAAVTASLRLIARRYLEPAPGPGVDSP